MFFLLIRFFFSFFFFWLFLYFIMSDSLGQLLKAHHQKKQEIKRNNGISCNFHRLVSSLFGFRLSVMLHKRGASPKQWSPCMCVIKTWVILPIFNLLFWNWCWVASPQSNNQMSPFSLSAIAWWFLVELGWALPVPKKVMSIGATIEKGKEKKKRDWF